MCEWSESPGFERLFRVKREESSDSGDGSG